MTIKYYDFGSEVIHKSERERFAASGIVECENGKYVRREDYERDTAELNEKIDTLLGDLMICEFLAKYSPDQLRMDDYSENGTVGIVKNLSIKHSNSIDKLLSIKAIIGDEL